MYKYTNNYHTTLKNSVKKKAGRTACLDNKFSNDYSAVT